MIEDRQTLKAVEAICGRLSERTATLFLGAGVNGDVKNDAGDRFPLGQGLSNWIARDLLSSPDLEASLEETAEIARFRVGENEVNNYLYREFVRFKPGSAHLALVQLPWDVIYTTNYDLLVEEAAKIRSGEAAGTICSISSSGTDLSNFTEEDILYYKLHGSIDSANTLEGRLVLTRDDYRHYEVYRKPLFKRLQRDLQNRTLVFIGYSLSDPNFRAILDDCRDELGSKTFPASFAVLHDFSNVEETYWREKYNVQLIQSDADVFLEEIKNTWIEQRISVISEEERKAKEYVQVDETARFSKVSESFYRVSPSDCTGQSNAELFFRGAEPTWADIRDEIAPIRDAYWPVLQSIYPELANPAAPARAYLITGAAGTGKTTLARTVAYELADEFFVLVYIPSTPLDARLLAPFVDEERSKRIIILIQHAAEHIKDIERFMEEVQQQSLPITMVLEERKNQWNAVRASMRGRFAPEEVSLGDLSNTEIEAILKALQQYNALGKLTGATQQEQVEHFTKLATKELIVALRELTSNSTFDQIVLDEFERIPSSVAKDTYKYVATLGQLDLPMRYELIMPLLDIRSDQLRTEIFSPTEGVLISGEEAGSSRHNSGFNLRTRHPIIASIIFDLVAPDDDSKFTLVNDLLTQLDPGFPEDKRVLEAIVRARQLIGTFVSEDKGRAIYERLETILPNNAFVFVHRSIFERGVRNYELATSYARKAIRANRNDPTALTTLGFALEAEAGTIEEGPRYQALLSEASELFDNVIKRDSTNPYGYLGRHNVLRKRVEREKDAEQRKLLQAKELSLIEEAHEATEESPIITTRLAQARERMGDSGEALDIVRIGLDNNPNDSRLRELWIRLVTEEGNKEDALSIALEGANIDPTSWRMQKHIARLKKDLKEPVEAIKGHYEAAIRHNRGNISLLVELAAYLFENGYYDDSHYLFSESYNMATNHEERRKIRGHWKNPDGTARVFEGKVQSTKGANARAMAIPENFEASFSRANSKLSELRNGEPIRFQVQFTASGPRAYVLLNY